LFPTDFYRPNRLDDWLSPILASADSATLQAPLAAFTFAASSCASKHPVGQLPRTKASRREL